MDWVGVAEVVVLIAGFFFGFVLFRIYAQIDNLESDLKETEATLRKQDELIKNEVKRSEEKCEERFKELEKETRTTVKELFKLVRSMETHLAKFEGEINLKLNEIKSDVKAIRNGK